MFYWQLLILGFTLNAAAWFLVQVRTSFSRQQIDWWLLDPQTPEINIPSVPLAAATLRKGRKTGTVTILRIGTGIDSAQVWIGIAGAPNSERAADAIAETAGCKLALKGTPPDPELDWAWWYSAPWYDKMTEQYMPREADAHYADMINQGLGEGDYLYITSKPERKGQRMISAALATDETLASSWFDDPPPNVKRPDPHPGALLAAAGGLCGAWPVILFAFQQTIGGDTYVGISHLIVGILVAGITFFTVLKALKYSPVVRRVIDGGSVKLPRKGTSSLLDRIRKTEERLVPAPIPLGHLAAWMSGGERTAVATPERLAPEILTDPGDTYIGKDLADRPLWILDKDRQHGMVAFGVPGSGKTTWLLNVLASDARAKNEGTERANIWIETKGEGARRALNVLREHGDNPLVFTSADTEGPLLGLIDWNEPRRAANTLTEAIRYAYERTDIYEQTAEVLNTVFQAIIAAPVHLWEEVGYPGRPNIIEMAYQLVGGDPESGMQARLDNLLKDVPEYDQVLRYTKHKTKHQQEFVLESSRNKLQGLRAAEGLWEARDRKTAYLPDLIRGLHSIVLNLGPPEGGAGAYSELTAQRCAAIVTFYLWDSIKTHCDGWQAQGKSIAIYSDELVDLAGFGDSNLEVIRALADQGRSRGVVPVFAAQRPGQLPSRTEEAVLGYGCRVYFNMRNSEVAQKAAEDLRGLYDYKDIMALNNWRGAAQVTRDGALHQAFTLCPDNM